MFSIMACPSTLSISLYILDSSRVIKTSSYSVKLGSTMSIINVFIAWLNLKYSSSSIKADLSANLDVKVSHRIYPVTLFNMVSYHYGYSSFILRKRPPCNYYFATDATVINIYGNFVTLDIGCFNHLSTIKVPFYKILGFFDIYLKHRMSQNRQLTNFFC